MSSESSGQHDPIDPAIQQEAALWLSRQQGADWSAESARALNDWLQEDPERRRAYEQMQFLWSRLGAEAADGGLGSVAGARLVLARRAVRRARLQRGSRRVAVLSACFGLFTWIGWTTLNVDQTLTTEALRLTQFKLPDGSRLDLDRYSEVRILFTPWRRDIRFLKGRAAFSVAHPDPRPFGVQVAQATIRDIGTVFTVRDMPGGARVAVTEGEVEIRMGATAGVYRLRAGEQFGFSVGTTGTVRPIEPVTTVDEGTALHWREGRLSYRSRPAGDVLDELALHHGVTLVVPQDRRRIRITGSVPVDELGASLEAMAAALSLHVRRAGPHRWLLEPVI